MLLERRQNIEPPKKTKNMYRTVLIIKDNVKLMMARIITDRKLMNPERVAQTLTCNKGR